MTLTLPMPPNVANARGHWAARRDAVNNWMQHAVAVERSLRGRRVPMQRATLAAVFYVGRNPMDDDNRTARIKPIGDLLRARKLIVNDKPPALTLTGIPSEVRAFPRRVELTLTEVG